MLWSRDLQVQVLPHALIINLCSKKKQQQKNKRATCGNHGMFSVMKTRTSSLQSLCLYY